MFKKVLVAEDMDFANTGIRKALSELNIEEIDYSHYCDEALLKLKRAKSDNSPFDLLISDLSFEKDGHAQKITSGDGLIQIVKQEFPELKVIVFSVEDKPYTIQTLYNDYHINAYVWKHRSGLNELSQAIKKVYASEPFYISPQLAHTLSSRNSIEITDYDIHLLEYLSQGLSQDDISTKLKERKLHPSSKSTVEKRLKFLKEHFNAHNPVHLVSITKDLGLI